MDEKRCARCLRGAWPGDSGEAGVVAGGGFVDLSANAAWAFLDGQDVCPYCQTPEERHAVAQRIAGHIEREIQRRQAEGLPPDELEEPLIGYVMSTRAEADVWDQGQARTAAADEGERDPEDVGGQPGTGGQPRSARSGDEVHLRVAFTGAFLTGHPLAVRLEGYGALQRALRQHLPGPDWRVTGLGPKGGTYESGGGFTEAIPLVIARREGVDLLPRLSTALAGRLRADGSRQHAFPPLLRTAPSGLVIDVYDLGVAVLTAWFDVCAPADELQATARAVRKLARLRSDGEARSALVDVLQDIASATADRYGEAVTSAAPAELRAAWLSRAALHTSESDERGRLLWLHPVHVLNCHESDERPELQASSVRTRTAISEQVQELAPAFQKTIELDGGVFAAGIGWSAVVVRKQSDVEELPVRLIQLHWAYYALYMEIDRGLLGVLNQERWSRHARLKELEKDADDVFSDYLRISGARARLDSHLSSLGGDELAVWEKIAEVQRFDALVDAVTRKLEVLDKLAERRVNLATAYRARRAGDILGCLTVLTVVTAAVAILAAVRGGLSDESGSTWLRAVVILVSFMVAMLVYYLAFVRTNKAPPPFTTRTGRGRSSSV